MANSFFGLNASLNENEERLGSSPDDIEGLETEEEYDALNDETFGTFESDGELEDWETQHEQLAGITEVNKSKNSDDAISLDITYESLTEACDRVLADFSQYDLTKFSYVSKKDRDRSRLQPNVPPPQPKPPQSNASASRFQTVEELERSLFKQSQPKPTPNRNVIAPNHPHPQLNPPQLNNPQLQLNHPQLNQHPQHMQQGPPQHHGQFPPHYKEVGMGRMPPGYPPMGGGMPPHTPPMWPPMHQMHPAMMRMMGNRVPPPPPPHMMPGGPLPPPPGFMFPHNNHPMNHQFNFPPPPRLNMPPGMQNNIRPPQYQPQRHDHYPKEGPTEHRDEYAGLMDNRDKQWLLNIQLFQVNTGTPYFDDYYYTVFKERQSKNKENVPERNKYRFNARFQRDGNVGHHSNHRGSSDRLDREQTPPQKRVSTPLQFENSLGKLQFASVTAPRKIIDMDVISHEKDSESSTNARDSRKTKQLLLELEAMYALLLHAEDLKNPLAISNMEKLKELKQKQRLREMEAATTPEAKQEVLRLLQQESVAVVESHSELLTRVLATLLQDDKLCSFIAIRKGKMLLLRLLPHLTLDLFGTQLHELWTKTLLSIPLVGRRDTIGDNILPRFYPLFKRYMSTCPMERILEMMTSLVEIQKLENSRSTPLSHQSKPPLYFVLSNKFGISALVSVLLRVQVLGNSCREQHLEEWVGFLTSLADTAASISTTLATPIEPINSHTLTRHLDRFQTINADRRLLIEKCFVETV